MKPTDLKPVIMKQPLGHFTNPQDVPVFGNQKNLEIQTAGYADK